MSYVKLDTGILDSTLWLSDSDVRVVFITMLAMAKPDGMVESTAPGIARRANLSIEATRAAIKVLESPDEDSRTLAEEGRRIIRIDGGYEITNFLKYRDKDHTAAERKRRERQRKKGNVTRDVTPVTPDVTHSDSDSDSDSEEKEKKDGADAPPPCPHHKILDAYHEILPELRSVREWTETRKHLLRSRWREKPERQNLDWWRDYFQQVRNSRFLMGKTNGDARPFQADLEWLIRPNNLPKVIEGKYEDADQKERYGEGGI